MSQAGQQAAGAAVGAAVGFAAGGPAGAFAGASIGAAGVGALQAHDASETQGIMDEAALKVNMAQARQTAAERSALLARNFRKSLASQVAIASMRGGSGSLVAQFGTEAFQNFIEDQGAIEAGLDVAETQGKLSSAQIDANKETRDLKALGKFSSTAFDAVNFSNLLKSGGK